MANDANTVKIRNPERILRILRKAAAGNLQIMMSPKDRQSLTLKGKAYGVEYQASEHSVRGRGIFISGFSQRAYAELKHARQLKCEFMLMSSRLVFVTKILRLKDQHLVVEIPSEFENVERRKQSRTHLSGSTKAFINLVDFVNHSNAITPAFSQYSALRSMVPLADISIGGVCIYTYTPLLNSYLGMDFETDKAFLCLPMEVPIPVKIRIQWVRSEKELRPKEKKHHKQIFKFGCQFIDLSEEAELKIKNLMSRIMQEDAI